MDKRQHLPTRRINETIEFELDGLKCVATGSTFENGELAELFIDAGKPGSDVNIAARDGAIAVSIALQFGAPSGKLYQTMTKLNNGSAAGPIGRALKLLTTPEK
jgi:hypothetical protein